MNACNTEIYANDCINYSQTESSDLLLILMIFFIVSVVCIFPQAMVRHM